VKGQLETGEAIEQIKAAQADLESAKIAADTGILQPAGKSRDEALGELSNCIKEIGALSKQVISASKNSPEDLGPVMKELASAASRTVLAATALAATVEDRVLQKTILNTVGKMTEELKNLMTSCKAVATSPEDPNLAKLLLEAEGE